MVTTEMKVRTYIDAETFLNHTRVALESNEAANGLMLGVCGRLVHHPEQVKATPCLKTVEDGDGLVLAAMMTPPHKLVVYGHQGDLDGGARILVKDLVSEAWRVPGMLGPSEIAKEFAEKWGEITGRGYGLEQRLRMHELREVIGPVPGRGRLRQATEADVELVARWWYGFYLEIFGEADQAEADRGARSRIAEGDIYLWEDKEPVSVAMKTRPTRKGISVGLVYTPPELRQRGYATACVGELSRMLLESGWEFCALFVDLANAAASRVYQKIGYRPVCDYDEYAFPEEG
jgi:predicted GNAT family acetyltransferase